PSGPRFSALWARLAGSPALVTGSFLGSQQAQCYTSSLGAILYKFNIGLRFLSRLHWRDAREGYPQSSPPTNKRPPGTYPRPILLLRKNHRSFTLPRGSRRRWALSR